MSKLRTEWDAAGITEEDQFTWAVNNPAVAAR
jgi:hypothetical protein